MQHKRKSIYLLTSAFLLSGVMFFEKPVKASDEIQSVQGVHYKWTGLGLCVWPGKTCRLTHTN